VRLIYRFYLLARDGDGARTSPCENIVIVVPGIEPAPWSMHPGKKRVLCTAIPTPLLCRSHCISKSSWGFDRRNLSIRLDDSSFVHSNELRTTMLWSREIPGYTILWQRRSFVPSIFARKRHSLFYRSLVLSALCTSFSSSIFLFVNFLLHRYIDA